MDREWAKRLAEDIISINCVACKEFPKPLTSSCCWCEGITEVIDFEIFREYKECTQDDEDLIALLWEEERKMILGDGDNGL